MATGKMLWFNEARDLGFILTDEGERLSVLGPGFAKGQKPKGRCAHSPVSFEIAEEKGERQAQNVTFLTEEPGRRARMRTRGIRTH
jgi:cold shock CspA family protein